MKIGNFGTKKYCRAPRWESAERPLLVHHVAQRIGRASRTVRYLAETGRLHGFKLGTGKVWAFSREEVARFLEVQDEQ